MLGRLSATGDAEREALAGARALEPGRDVAGKEAVAGADGGNRLELIDASLVAAPLGTLADERDAACLGGDDRLTGSHVEQAVEAQGEVGSVVELLADRFLCLDEVGCDHRGLPTQAGAHVLAVGIENREHIQSPKLGHEAEVDVLRHARRHAAREHADRRSPREVEQALDETLRLLLGDFRPAVVDLGLLGGGRVDDGEVGPCFSGDPGERRQHAFLPEMVEQPRTACSAGEAGGDHRAAEQAQRAGDVDALATCHRPRVHRAMALAQPEVGNRDGPIDCRIQGDCENQWSSLLARSQATGRRRQRRRRSLTTTKPTKTIARAANVSAHVSALGPGTTAS